MTIPHRFDRTDRGDTVTVFLNGEIKVATQKHPAWGLIVTELLKGSPNEATLQEYFDDPTKAIRDNVAAYSDRVVVDNGRVVLDGDTVTGPLADKILRVYASGGSVKPLVKFLENVSNNPSHRSRNQLFGYLQKHDFQITEDGNFIAYKGLTANGTSIHAGTAVVDGVEVNGQIPNDLGSTISMPRKDISDDPNKACHVGLHAGAWDYANNFGRGATAKVEINPANVVCIPVDHSWQKMRVCCYKVIEVNLPEPNDPSTAYDNGDDVADPWDEAYDTGFEDGYLEGQYDAEQGVWG